MPKITIEVKKSVMLLHAGYRPTQNWELVPGEYELEMVENPFLKNNPPYGDDDWFVITGTKWGAGTEYWRRLEAEGSIAVKNVSYPPWTWSKVDVSMLT